MRTVTYGAAVSLDGYITGPDGAIDWLHMGRDVTEIMRTYWATIDTILMGRKTWEFAAGMGGGGGGDAAGTGGERGGEDIPMTGITTYVFSRTLPGLRRKGVRLVRDDAAAFVRALKEQPGKGICLMGGGELARSLLDAGLVDEVGLNIHPVLLGGGVPMFAAPGTRVRLELTGCRQLDGGCVYALYRVRPPVARAARRKRVAQARAH
jgi:dihydrofolate reductase